MAISLSSSSPSSSFFSSSSSESFFSSYPSGHSERSGDVSFCCQSTCGIRAGARRKLTHQQTRTPRMRENFHAVLCSDWSEGADLEADLTLTRSRSDIHNQQIKHFYSFRCEAVGFRILTSSRQFLSSRVSMAVCEK